MLDVQDEIDLAIDAARENMPDAIQTLISLCQADLFYGPVYLDGEGERCECFDEGARRFGFTAACRTIADWLDENVSDVATESYWHDDEGEERTETETVTGSRERIIAVLIGPTLARHL